MKGDSPEGQVSRNSEGDRHSNIETAATAAAATAAAATAATATAAAATAAAEQTNKQTTHAHANKEVERRQ